MLDLRTWSALPHVGGVVPLFEHCLRCSLHGCELCHNRCHAGCTVSTLARAGSLHLCSCRAARLGSGAPALPVSRVLAGLRLVDPPWISCSVGERAPHRYLRLPLHQAGSWNWQLCETPEKREGSRFQGLGPCPWELATALCEPLMTQEVQWGCLQWTDDSRSRQQCRQIVCQRNKNRL